MRQSNYDWVCKHMKASGTGIELCAPLDHHGKSLHLFLTLLRLLSCWTVAVPGPYLPLMPAVVAPGRFNVKLMFLMTPSRVFSSYLSKQPVMCSIFPSVPPSLFLFKALTAQHPSTTFSGSQKGSVHWGDNAFLLIKYLEEVYSESVSLMLKYLYDF